MGDQFASGYALLVAVDENRVARLALPVVSKDVQAVAQVLTHPARCAYIQDNVKVVSGVNASRQGILDGLAWLAKKLAADASGSATAVIYYSGHGWRDASSGSPAHYLIPYDISEDALRLTALRAEDFAAAVEEITPDRLLVILDCCHAGGMDIKDLGPTGGARDARTAATGYVSSAIPAAVFAGGQKTLTPPPDSEHFDLLARGRGRAILSSSQGEQSSYVRRDGSMSIFTYHLIEALSGHAQPAEGASEVLVSDLMSHVTRRVPQSALADREAEQIPDFVISGNFPVALLLGGRGLDKGMAAPDPLEPLAPERPQADAIISTGGGAVIGGNAQIGQANLAGGDIHSIHGDYVDGDKVAGDRISVGNISGVGVAIGRGARANVAGGDTGKGLTQLFRVVHRQIELRPPDPGLDKDELEQIVARIEAEAAKGEGANPTKVERWLNALADLAPDVFELSVAALANPAAEVAGAIREVAERLRTSI